MKRNSTQNTLLLYAFNETDLCGSDAAQRLIDGDPLVASDYKALTESINSLDKFIAEPSDKCIQRILAFSAR